MCKHILIKDFNTETDLEVLKDFTNKTYDHDGFGTIIRFKNNTLYTYKSLDIAEFYIELTQILCQYEIKDVIVHHRTSTNVKGIDYAHPFEYKGKYMTHNGVITVPFKYNTITTNDSEILLHHLIDTDFNTKDISGYFSCFILDDESTTILVDSTAPMYTDGRIYQSHNFENSTKIELQKIVYDLNNNRTMTPIEIQKSSYGMDKAHLSLGYSNDNHYYSNESEFDRNYDEFCITNTRYDKVSDFFDCINAMDERKLSENLGNPKKLKSTIREIAWYIGIDLDESEIHAILKSFKIFVKKCKDYNLISHSLHLF